MNRKRSREDIRELLDRAEIQKKDKARMGKKDKKKYIFILIPIILVIGIMILKYNNSGTIKDKTYMGDIKLYLMKIEKLEDRYNKNMKDIDMISNGLFKKEIDRAVAKKEIEDIIYNLEEMENILENGIEMPKKGSYENLVIESKESLLKSIKHYREGIYIYTKLIDLGGVKPSQDPAIMKEYELSNTNFNNYLVSKEKLEYYIMLHDKEEE